VESLRAVWAHPTNGCNLGFCVTSASETLTLRPKKTSEPHFENAEKALVFKHSKPDLKICIPEATQNGSRSDPKATPECSQSVPLFVEKDPSRIPKVC